MPAYTWISLAFFLACLAGGTLWAAVNARRAWRRGKPALARMTDSSAALSMRSTELERRVAVLEPKLAELQRDADRLARGIAFARLQWGVVKQAGSIASFASLFVPRK